MSRHLAGRGRSTTPPAAKPVEEIPCDLTDKLTLGQFLKIANLIESGAEAKMVIADGEVSVNGETETRRGRGLVAGDTVDLGGHSARVVNKNYDADADADADEA